MSKQMLATLLAHSPLFAGLTAAERLHLAESAFDRHYEHGGILFSQGSPASGMFVVLHGRVKVFQLTQDGHEVVLHLVSPGQTIAEAAVLQRGSYPASARAEEDTRLLFLPADVLLDFITLNPDLALRMIASLSNRLREFTRMLHEQQRGSALTRVASWLLRQQAQNTEGGIRLDMSRELLAGTLGLTRETVSRVFSRLQKQGVIVVKRKEIHVVQPEALRELEAYTPDGAVTEPHKDASQRSG